MSANTTWYVRVLKAHEETVEVSAVTMAEAMAEASSLPGVITVQQVRHWSEMCSNCDTLIPPGCGGVFEDQAACRLSKLHHTDTV